MEYFRLFLKMDDIFGELEPLLDFVGNTSCDDAKASF